MKRLITVFSAFIGLTMMASCEDLAGVNRLSDLTSLPEVSQQFIAKHFGSNVKVREYERDAEDNTYNVELRNGYEFEFDAQGALVEVSAPDRKDIAVGIVTDILPANAVNYLDVEDRLDDIDDIKVLRTGEYYVSIDKALADVNYWFDKDGNLTQKLRD